MGVNFPLECLEDASPSSCVFDSRRTVYTVSISASVYHQCRRSQGIVYLGWL